MISFKLNSCLLFTQIDIFHLRERDLLSRFAAEVLEYQAQGKSARRLSRVYEQQASRGGQSHNTGYYSDVRRANMTRSIVLYPPYFSL